jgi:hypothetical protein
VLDRGGVEIALERGDLLRQLGALLRPGLALAEGA